MGHRARTADRNRTVHIPAIIYLGRMRIMFFLKKSEKKYPHTATYGRRITVESQKSPRPPAQMAV